MRAKSIETWIDDATIIATKIDVQTVLENNRVGKTQKDVR